jgi:hypothetical protein
VDDILGYTKTELENFILSILIAAALRLLPVDNTLHRTALQVEKSHIQAVEAKKAEDIFIWSSVDGVLLISRKASNKGKLQPLMSASYSPLLSISIPAFG